MNLEIKTLHGVEIKNDDGGIRRAKVPITKENKRKMVETNNCPDTGASVSISSRNLMRKMGITQDNLIQDRVAAAEGSTIKAWGFLPVKMKITIIVVWVSRAGRMPLLSRRQWHHSGNSFRVKRSSTGTSS